MCVLAPFTHALVALVSLLFSVQQLRSCAGNPSLLVTSMTDRPDSIQFLMVAYRLERAALIAMPLLIRDYTPLHI